MQDDENPHYRPDAGPNSAMVKKARKWVARVAGSGKNDDKTEWEAEFLTSLDQRLETYGRAFADPDKGQLSAPFSLRQGLKLKEIGRKLKPKTEQKSATPAARNSSLKPKAEKPKKGLAQKGLAQKGLAQKGGLSRKSGLKRTGFSSFKRPTP